jgi:hypothetical protein
LFFYIIFVFCKNVEKKGRVWWFYINKYGSVRKWRWKVKWEWKFKWVVTVLDLWVLFKEFKEEEIWWEGF